MQSRKVTVRRSALVEVGDGDGVVSCDLVVSTATVVGSEVGAAGVSVTVGILVVS